MAHLLQVSGRRDVYASLPLYGLQHDRDRVIGGRILDRLDVVERDVGAADGDGLEYLLVVRLSRGGDVHHRPAVEGVERGDDLVGAAPVDLAVLAGELHRSLVRLRPAVADEHPVERAVVYEDLRQLQLRDGIELVGGLEERPGLLGDRVGDDRVGVPDVVDGPTCGEVEILLTVIVPDSSALATDDHDGLPPYHEHVVPAFDLFPVGGHSTHLQ